MVNRNTNTNCYLYIKLDANGLPEFDVFLEKNVQLMNGGLFLEYP